jgi:hypothetical protein
MDKQIKIISGNKIIFLMIKVESSELMQHYKILLLQKQVQGPKINTFSTDDIFNTI